MQKSSSEILNEIAQDISSGRDCYYNPQTLEIISIPDLENCIDDEYAEIFQDDLNKVKAEKSGFIKIDTLTSSESFTIMNSFTEQLMDSKLKKSLQYILENRKPFKNFKNAVDNSEYRESWFEFKQANIEKIVEERIKLN